MGKQSLQNWESRHKSLAYWVAVFGGSGLLRPAPGTWGSLAALLAGFIMLVGMKFSIPYFLISIILVTLIGTKAINHIESRTQVHDAPEIVIDEVAGLWISLLPLYSIGFHPVWFFAAFILFRFFDIVKPWPIGWLDKYIAGGFGVMADDIVAGLFAAGILYAIAIYIPF